MKGFCFTTLGNFVSFAAVLIKGPLLNAVPPNPFEAPASENIPQFFFAVMLPAFLGKAGIPGGSVVMLPAVSESVGLSPAPGSATATACALLLGIDALRDMGQTCLNVIGDLVCAAVAAKTETAKDKKP